MRAGRGAARGGSGAGGQGGRGSAGRGGGPLALRGHQLREVGDAGGGDGEFGDAVSCRAEAVDEHGEVPAPDLGGDGGGVLGDGGEHVRDHLEVGGAEVGAEFAGGLGAFDEAGDDGAHAVAGVADLVAVVGAEHHELAEAEVAGHGGGDELEVGDEALPGVGDGASLFGDGDEGVDAVPEQFGDEGFLVGEAAVDGADADAGGPGDVVEGGVESAFGEQVGGGGEYALPVPFGVAAKWAFAASVT